MYSIHRSITSTYIVRKRTARFYTIQLRVAGILVVGSFQMFIHKLFTKYNINTIYIKYIYKTLLQAVSYSRQLINGISKKFFIYL